MKMPKPSEVDKDRFRRLVPDDPRVEVKPMFGNLAAFVNGNMFMGLFGTQVGLKLDKSSLSRVMALEGAGPFGPADRPMGGYVSLPPAMAEDPDEAQPLIEQSLAHVAALPPKVKKADR